MTRSSYVKVLLIVVVGLMLPETGSAQHATTVSDGPELRITTGDPAGEDGGEASFITERRFAIGLSVGYSTVSQNEWFDFWQGMLVNFPRQLGRRVEISRASSGVPVSLFLGVAAARRLQIFLSGTYLQSAVEVTEFDINRYYTRMKYVHVDASTGLRYRVIDLADHLSLTVHGSAGAASSNYHHEEWNEGPTSNKVYPSQRSNAVLPVLRGGLGLEYVHNDLGVTLNGAYRHVPPAHMDKDFDATMDPPDRERTTFHTLYDMRGIELTLGLMYYL